MKGKLSGLYILLMSASSSILKWYSKLPNVRGGFHSDNSYPKASHVGFGLVLGEDGKRFRTRNTKRFEKPMFKAKRTPKWIDERRMTGSMKRYTF